MDRRQCSCVCVRVCTQTHTEKSHLPMMIRHPNQCDYVTPHYCSRCSTAFGMNGRIRRRWRRRSHQGSYRTHLVALYDTVLSRISSIEKRDKRASERASEPPQQHTNNAAKRDILDDGYGLICACCVRSFVCFLLLFLIFIARQLLFHVRAAFFSAHTLRASASILTMTICRYNEIPCAF